MINLSLGGWSWVLRQQLLSIGVNVLMSQTVETLGCILKALFWVVNSLQAGKKCYDRWVSTISCPRIWTNTRTHKQSSGVSLAYANGCHDAAKARPHRIHADLSDFNENATSTYVIRRLFALWTWKALTGSDYRDHSRHFSSFLPATWPAKTSWTTKNLRHVGCSSAQLPTSKTRWCQRLPRRQWE